MEPAVNSRPDLYFYRDHHGREVDFIIPRAGRLHLIECKWAESPSIQQRGFAELESLVSGKRILSRTIVTPGATTRPLSAQVQAGDSVRLAWLDPV